MKKYSICIPAYKSLFLKESIESVLNQKYLNYELIILNDDSPQPVEKIVDSISSSKIKYYKNTINVGAKNLVHNWNKCLSYCTGDYIVIMGDDDSLEPNYLEEFNLLIDRYPDLDVYHCRSKIIDEESNPIMLTPSWPEFETVYDCIWHRITERRSQYISDFVYKISTLREKDGFYDLPLAWGSDDISAFLACSKKGIAHTNKPVFNYRSNSLSITSSGQPLIKMESNLIYESWLKGFLVNVPSDENEKIVYNDICKNFTKYMQARKIYVMINSMSKQPFRNFMMWYTNRKVYNINILEIGFSLLNSFKRQIARNIY